MQLRGIETVGEVYAESKGKIKADITKRIHAGASDRIIVESTLVQISEFAIYTGFRKENILSMRIEPIRFHDISQTGEVILNIKGRRTEIFPLGPTVVELLRRVIGDRKEGFVFINPKTGKRYVSIHKTFDRVVKKLGYTVNRTKLRIHVLRHVFATWLHQEGVSLDILRPLMGHKNRATTNRYITIDRLAAGQMLSYMPRIRIPKAIKKP